MRVGPKGSHKCPYKRKTDRQGRWQGEDRDGGWHDAIPNQGKPVDTRSSKKPGVNSPLEP